jgi:hypothetical protein
MAGRAGFVFRYDDLSILKRFFIKNPEVKKTRGAGFFVSMPFFIAFLRPDIYPLWDTLSLFPAFRVLIFSKNTYRGGCIPDFTGLCRVCVFLEKNN